MATRLSHKSLHPQHGRETNNNEHPPMLQEFWRTLFSRKTTTPTNPGITHTFSRASRYSQTSTITLYLRHSFNGRDSDSRPCNLFLALVPKIISPRPYTSFRLHAYSGPRHINLALQVGAGQECTLWIQKGAFLLCWCYRLNLWPYCRRVG